VPLFKLPNIFLIFGLVACSIEGSLPCHPLLHAIHVNKTLASFSHAPIIQIIIAPPFLAKTFRLLNPGSVDGGLSTKKESSKGKASKDNLHVAEQAWSSSNFLDLDGEEEENPKYVNILKKLIKTSKHWRSPRRPKRLKRPKWQKRPKRRDSNLRPKRSSKLRRTQFK